MGVRGRRSQIPDSSGTRGGRALGFECFEKFILRTYLMAAHCRAICLQNPFPNGLFICEKLQGLYIRSSHPPDGPQLSRSFLRLQPLLFHQTQPAGPHTHTSNHQAPTPSPAPGLPAARDQQRRVISR